MEVAITKRPIVVEIGAGSSVLTDILARIARIRSRASQWGVENDVTLSEYLAGYSVEADFASGYYRNGFVEGAAPSVIPGWAFARTGAGTARTAKNALQSFATGVPRITSRGLLVEAARTNLAIRTQEFDNASWTKARATVTANAAVAPDGTTTADKLVEDTTAANNHRIEQAISGLTVGQSHTTFVYAKAGERTKLWLVSTGGLVGQASFDLSGAGSVLSTSTATATIEALADGWYRCAMTVSAATLTTATWSIRLADAAGNAVYNGDGASGLYLWGGQFERGGFASSYIPTTSAAATRGLDAGSVALDVLPDEFTLYLEVEFMGVTGLAQYLGSVTDGTASHRLALARDNTGNGITLLHTRNGVNSTYTVGTGVSGARTVKVAMTYRDGAYRVAVDGVLGTAVPATPPVGLNKFNRGTVGNADTPLEGYLRDDLILRASVSDDTLIAMTS